MCFMNSYVRTVHRGMNSLWNNFELNTFSQVSPSPTGRDLKVLIFQPKILFITDLQEKKETVVEINIFLTNFRYSDAWR